MSALSLRAPISGLLDFARPVVAPKVRRYAAMALLIDAALVLTLLVAIQSYLPEQYGASSSIAGYVLACYGAAKLVGQLPAGRLIDRRGPRDCLLAGLALASLGQIAMMLGIVQSELVIVAAGLYGLGSAAIWPATFSLATAEFAEGERARFSAGMTVATGVGVGLALGLAVVLPARFPYAAAIALSFGATAGALYLARGFPAMRSETHAEAVAEPLSLGVVRSLISPRRVAFSLIILVQGAILGALLSVFRSYGRDSLGVSMRHELLLFAPAAAAAALAVVIAGSVADRFGRIPVLGVGFLITTIGVWGLSATSLDSSVMVLGVFAAVGLALALPSSSALAMDLSHGTRTGILLGWFLTMEGLGHAAGPAAAGVLEHAGGVSSVLWLVGGMSAVVALIALVPPVWATARAAEAGRRPFRTLFSASAKGALVFSLGFPVFGMYFAYQSGSQLYGEMISHGPRERMEVTLTFDDGPNYPWTPRIADTLQQYGVQGTFFMVGMNAEAHPEIVRDLVARGDLIGNHTYRHHKSDALFDIGYGELWKAERAIYSAAGVCPAFYRPPNGFHTPWQLHTVSNDNLKTVTWDVIPQDWKDPPSQTIVDRVLNDVRPGSIILLHDGDDTNQGTDRSATLNALPGIIEGLRARGYEFVRLDEMLSLPPYLPSCETEP